MTSNMHLSTVSWAHCRIVLAIRTELEPPFEKVPATRDIECTDTKNDSANHLSSQVLSSTRGMPSSTMLGPNWRGVLATGQACPRSTISRSKLSQPRQGLHHLTYHLMIAWLGEAKRVYDSH